MLKKDSQIISLQLPKELVEKLKADAEKNFMSLSAYIRKMLTMHMEKNTHE